MDKIEQYLVQYKYPLLMCLLGGVLLSGGIVSSGLLNQAPTQDIKSKPNFQASLVENPTGIKVDVSGEVVKPGVYSLGNSSRVEDVIKSAGGFSTQADPDYIAKRLNLSAKLTDGQKLYIPKTGESIAGISTVVAASQDSKSSQISINNSSGSDLEKLQGIGPVTAQKIIDNRPYSKLEDLLSKKVVSKSVYEKIKEQVSLD